MNFLCFVLHITKHCRNLNLELYWIFYYLFLLIFVSAVGFFLFCFCFFFHQWAPSIALSCSKTPEKNFLTCMTMSIKTPWSTKDGQVPGSKLSRILNIGQQLANRTPYPDYKFLSNSHLYIAVIGKKKTALSLKSFGNNEYCIYFSLLSSGFAHRMPRYVVITTCD